MTRDLPEPTVDEDAERVAFTEWYHKKFNKLPTVGKPRYRAVAELMWAAWLASARK